MSLVGGRRMTSTALRPRLRAAGEGRLHAPGHPIGLVCVVKPNKTPQMGEFVLIKLTDGRSTVKEFIWHRDGEYVLNAISNGECLVLRED